MAFSVAGLTDLITDRAEGLLFTPSDWEDLSRKIGVLVAARGDWHLMGNAGRIKVENEFRVELSAAKMARLFSGEIIS